VVVVPHGEPPPPGLEGLEGLAWVRIADTEEALAAALPEAEIVLTTDFRGHQLEAAWPAASRVRWVHATMAGVDAVIFPALARSEVVVTNARGLFDRSIAEYVVGCILAFAKDFGGNYALKAERRWRHRETERVEGKAVLVVGVGGIGREVARACRAMGMRVKGIARRAREDAEIGTIHAIEELEARLGDADYVVVAAPLTDATHGLFDARRLAAMKPTARLINVGRGPLVVTEALVEALREGVLAGAALDVFEQEPLPPHHPLWDLPQVMISAHMAGDFVGWRQATIAQFADNLARYVAGQPLVNVVDKERGYVPSSLSEGT